MIEGKDDEETVRLTCEGLGISESEARFMLAIERGEIDGDIVEVEDPKPAPDILGRVLDYLKIRRPE